MTAGIEMPDKPVVPNTRTLLSRQAAIGLSYAILTLGGLAMVVPFIWMVLTSLKQRSEIIAYPPIWFPAQPSLKLYAEVMSGIAFGRYFINSLWTATLATIAVIFTSALVGYVLAKYQFRGRDILFYFIVATMMIPWPVLIIPQFLIALQLKIFDSLWALVFPGLFSAFGIFMMRQYFHSIPNDLIDAGRVDGASEPAIFLRIILPLSGPAMAAMGIFHFIGHWNNFLWPLIVLNSPDNFTLPIGLASFATREWTDYALVNAGNTIAVVPVLIVFLILQRRFVEGITMTGMK
jgi:multiple sugar transport system permease protein